MPRWCTLAWMLLLMMGLPVSGRAQSDGWGPPDANSIQQAGWKKPLPGQYHPLPPAAAAPGYGAPGPYSYPATGIGGTTYEQLPDDTGWLYEGSPLERGLANLFRHSYLRVEYLNWSYTDPGNNILGSPTNFVADPTVPFPETNPVTGNTFNVVAPSLAGVATNSNNGIRMTFGLPVTPEGTLETSIFTLQQSSSTRGVPDVRGFATQQVDTNGDGIPDTVLTDANGIPINFSVNTVGAVAQSTLIDGQVPAGDNFFLLNDLGYSYTIKSRLWGTETNWVVAPYDEGSAIRFQPMVGIRLLNFNEQIAQRGLYTYTFIDPITGLQQTQPGDRRINSGANNYIYGPQIGFRAETNAFSWLSIGVQPKIMLGFNSYKTTLSTQEVLAPPDLTTGVARDPSQNIYKKNTTFGVVADLETYSKVRIRDNLSIFVAYNLIWTGLVTRPQDDVVYNIQSAPSRSFFVLDPKYSGLLIQGISIGGEVQW